MTDDEYLCPNCCTPWKCNGPHIPDPDYVDPIAALMAENARLWERVADLENRLA